MLSYDDTIRFSVPTFEKVVTAPDLILFALAVGAGRRLPGEEALRFVYEKGLVGLPPWYSTLAWLRTDWLADLGIDTTALVHIREEMEIFAAPAAGDVFRIENRVRDVIDRGRERGAVLVVDTAFRRNDEPGPAARKTTHLLCRRDGGVVGAPPSTLPPRETFPETAPSGTLTIPIDPDQAARFRLCGDFNPIHIDPEAAAIAGFPKPLLHGLCTVAMIWVALVQDGAALGGRTIGSYRCAFIGPVHPGETIELDHWTSPEGVTFRARVGATRTVIEGAATFA